MQLLKKIGEGYLNKEKIVVAVDKDLREVHIFSGEPFLDGMFGKYCVDIKLPKRIIKK